MAQQKAGALKQQGNTGQAAATNISSLFFARSLSILEPWLLAPWMWTRTTMWSCCWSARTEGTQGVVACSVSLL